MRAQYSSVSALTQKSSPALPSPLVLAISVVVQPHGIALVPGRAGHLAGEAAGEGAFLGEVDALGQAVLQPGNSRLAPGVFIATVLGNDAIRVHDHAEQR